MQKKLITFAFLIMLCCACASVGDKPPVAVNPNDTEQSAVESEQIPESAYRENREILSDSILFLLEVAADILIWK
jgi:hypothetical protein